MASHDFLEFLGTCASANDEDLHVVTWQHPPRSGTSRGAGRSGRRGRARGEIGPGALAARVLATH